MEKLEPASRHIMKSNTATKRSIEYLWSHRKKNVLVENLGEKQYKREHRLWETNRKKIVKVIAEVYHCLLNRQ